MLTYHNLTQGSDPWHALRIGKVTASNAHVLLSKGKYAATGTAGLHTSGFWAERGHILENEAIEVYEAITGLTVERTGFITNEDYPDCGFSPDGYVELNGSLMPIEVKCFAEARHLLCLEDTPIEVYAQIQFGMMITESDKTMLLHYNPDIADDKLCFKAIEVHRDELLIERLNENSA